MSDDKKNEGLGLATDINIKRAEYKELLIEYHKAKSNLDALRVRLNALEEILGKEKTI